MAGRRTSNLDTLTPRELEVLELLKSGYSNRGIAEELGINSRDIRAWEVTPDGERHQISRDFEYAVASDSLSLDELVKIARSVILAP